MKVIFLDIDGVLNSVESMTIKHSLKERHTDMPCKVYVRYLNKIIESTGAKLVISSTWRLGNTSWLLDMLLYALDCTGQVVGSTYHISGCTRGAEIKKFLEHNNVEKFVILDDDSDMEDLLPYLVQTSNKVGLTEEDADKAIDILMSN